MMEHETIRRRRMGMVAGVGDVASGIYPGMSGRWTAQQLDQLWTAGVNATDPATTNQMYADTTAAISQGYPLSAAGQASYQKFAAYAKKLATVTAMTPAQYAQYKASGGGGPLSGLGDKLASLPFVGPLISKFTGGAPPVAPIPVAQPKESFLDMVLSPVGIVVGAVVVGGVAYAATRQPGRLPVKRRR